MTTLDLNANAICEPLCRMLNDISDNFEHEIMTIKVSWQFKE